ncbi:DUF2714 domain-containing protein [Mycoplasma enhydrae]|uniref:MSC_0623 family F1-like ATPase-associated protein n=1 Tax=Mycoplasma enhydrae TaxID=2499220 RepID=UPI00197BE999|nr:DUF2714 domain-containing protein [Mycoplasma enhydrae]MBN4089569.1 DUF2714 domain-containing protein [Mycoplasma enhydrae]MCV3753582.1 DUF2714 domain-containing protein [Mycoplasma enhydrae]
MKDKEHQKFISNKNKILFWLEQNLTKDNFINFNKLISTIILKNSLNKSSLEVTSFLDKLKSLVSKCSAIEYQDFKVEFEINTKFSSTKKIPSIQKLNQSKKYELQLEEIYNQEILSLIKNYYVEFLPNIVLYIANDSLEYRIYIMSQYFEIKQEGKENEHKKNK